MSNQKLDIDEIYATFQPKILRYLSRMLSGNEAEDLTQEVFVKVAKALPEFREEAQLSTWIYRIASNTALDRLRSASFKQQQREKTAGDSGTELLAEPEDRNLWSDEKKSDSGQLLIRQEMNSCIREYIDQLPDDYRLTLLLSEMEGFKNREIAEILGISLETVKIRLHRARTKLKESLGEHCSFYLDERSELACDRKKPNPL